MENAGFLLALERLHPPRRNQVDLKGGKERTLLDVGNTPKRLLVFVGVKLGCWLGALWLWWLFFVFSYLPWGLGREVCFLKAQVCDVCSVHVDGQMVGTP